jgi:hypothetical protein
MRKKSKFTTFKKSGCRTGEDAMMQYVIKNPEMAFLFQPELAAKLKKFGGKAMLESKGIRAEDYNFRGGLECFRKDVEHILSNFKD